jgi:3-hydroxypropanoate dehydrogenase
MIDQQAQNVLFNDARTYSAWLDKPVDPALLKQVFDLTKMAPTAANCQPLRVVFVTSKEGKEKLKPTLDEGNVAKTMAAPVTAILAMDMAIYDQLPKLFPHADARSWFAGNDALILATAFRNASLQGGYFMLAARALGLDCGPMSGFDTVKLDAAFFAGTTIKSNFLCNLGYGDASKLHPRLPRPEFTDFCQVV